MRIYLTALIGLIISSCSNGQTTIAENGIKISNGGITKKQSELLFFKTKSFPNNIELSITLIKNGKTDTTTLIENYKNTFEIGSITKVFTARLLSNLVSDQELKLNDNVQDYLDFKIKSENRITFKELANHTSGLPKLPSNLDFLFVDQDNPYKNYDKEKLVSYLTKEVELNQEPGIKYEYSNPDAGILGFELATISKSYNKSLLQEKIFTKYKMVNSTSTRENIKVNLLKD
ncbi:serine hydrolase domain-containing protein [Aquimarina sp. W85]|uniref:serine hydrolase domain-containing protein n=1 Tax=Aquimarina rhodophyticola TaxID=3342246 RepID=UPI003673411A